MTHPLTDKAVEAGARAMMLVTAQAPGHGKRSREHFVLSSDPDDAFGGSSKGGIRATHWLPLPEPPSKETK